MHGVADRAALALTANFGTSIADSRRVFIFLTEAQPGGKKALVEDSDHLATIHFLLSLLISMLVTMMAHLCWTVVDQDIYSGRDENAYMYLLLVAGMSMGTAWVGLAFLDAAAVALYVCILDDPTALQNTKPEVYEDLVHSSTSRLFQDPAKSLRNKTSERRASMLAPWRLVC